MQKVDAACLLFFLVTDKLGFILKVAILNR